MSQKIETQHINTNYCQAQLQLTMAIELSSIITVTVYSGNRMYSKTFFGKLVILVSLNLNGRRPTNILHGRLPNFKHGRQPQFS